jgi:hypothetical protein
MARWNQSGKLSYTRLLIFSTIMIACFVLSMAFAAPKARAASGGLSATFGVNGGYTYYYTSRYHSSGSISYENLSGYTTMSDGTTSSTMCGGYDTMALRHSNTGVEFASVTFMGTQYQWKGFQPANMGPRTFLVALKGTGACGGPPYMKTRTISGVIYY